MCTRYEISFGSGRGRLGGGVFFIFNTEINWYIYTLYELIVVTGYTISECGRVVGEKKYYFFFLFFISARHIKKKKRINVMVRASTTRPLNESPRAGSLAYVQEVLNGLAVSYKIIFYILYMISFFLFSLWGCVCVLKNGLTTICCTHINIQSYRTLSVYDSLIIITTNIFIFYLRLFDFNCTPAE